MRRRFSIGIDLGTTNSVLAFVPLEDSDASSVQQSSEFDERSLPIDGLSEVPIRLLRIPQLTAPNQTESLDGLPSFVYLLTADEVSESALTGFGDRCVGAFARSNSAQSPDRTVVAAKSWLCHRGVNRYEAILPWAGEDADTDDADSNSHVALKLSPVDASAAYLSHLAAAWNRVFIDAPIDEQLVTLTVPASFDMSARELTLEAARRSGLPEDLILLEEPQAAIYHWITAIGDRWRSHLSDGDVVLVCDCGGGTTDLTLLACEAVDGELQLQRVAVGDHLLIGGDNMDLALAHHASQRFAEKGVKLNPWQAIGLWHSCRAAKETLLGVQESNDRKPHGLMLNGSSLDQNEQNNVKDRETYSVAVLGRGRKLIGGTVHVDLQRKEVEEVLIEGFFPRCKGDDSPQSDTEIGFQELGLPFEADTAITRHVAAFLSIHSSRPTKVLFNGGVFRAKRLRQRLLEVIQSWNTNGETLEQLGGPEDLDIAVASGAAYYGWSKTHGGIRIRGGIAKNYYVGIETSGLAVPGMQRPIQAVCVAPKGMEEGTESPLFGREFGLIVGKPVQFRFFSSSTRESDRFGTTVKNFDLEELQETDPLRMTIPASRDEEGGAGSDEVQNERGIVPVRFLSKITELGMFELWCQSTSDHRRWKLEFNVRPLEAEVR